MVSTTQILTVKDLIELLSQKEDKDEHIGYLVSIKKHWDAQEHQAIVLVGPLKET